MKKQVLAILLLLSLSAILVVSEPIFVPRVEASTSTWSVGASSDDCTRRLVSSYFSLTLGEAICGDLWSNDYDYRSGFRFLNIHIPQGAYIVSAYLKLTAKSGSVPVSTKIDGEDADNATTFSTADDYDGRVRTTALVGWFISAWASGTVYYSPNIKSIIQEILDRPGWNSGNAMVFFWRDTDGWGGYIQYASCWSYDGSSAYAPKLEITWGFTPVTKDTFISAYSSDANFGTENYLEVRARSIGGVAHDRRILLEFDISGVPEGATITSAVLSLVCSLVSASGRTYEIRRITGSWTETGVTWNNQPTITETNGVNVSAPSSTGWWNNTVTAMVADARNEGTIVGFRIKDSVEGGALKYSKFHSKEYDNLDPWLEVTWEAEGEAYEQVITETIQVTDSISKHPTIVKSEIIRVYDIITKHPWITKTETIRMYESISEKKLYEYYNTGADVGGTIFGVYWLGQTFTVKSIVRIISVKLEMFRDGNPGILTVGIRATDASGHPTGLDLTNGTINANTFVEYVPKWYEITLTEYSLSANTKYAIVCRAISGDFANSVHWTADSSSPTYIDGNEEVSSDSGSSWESSIGWDMMFEIWGVEITFSPIKDITIVRCELVTLLDLLIKHPTIIKSEMLNIFDQLSKHITIVKEETLNVIDQLSFLLTKLITETIIEQIIIPDQITIHTTRVVNEIINILDYISKHVTITKNEILDVRDVITKYMTIIITETITIFDTIIFIKEKAFNILPYILLAVVILIPIAVIFYGVMKR